MADETKSEGKAAEKAAAVEDVKEARAEGEEAPQTDEDGNPIDAEGNIVRTSDDPQPDFGVNPNS